MWKKIFASIVFEVVLISFANASDDGLILRFSDYPVEVYKYSLHIPSYYVKTGNVWRDDMGKQVEAPHINFAGKYYIGVHSCGAECRYYTLSDLKSNRESHALDMFSSEEGAPMKINDGRIYTIELVSRPNSKLLVAQFHIEETDRMPSECRQRMFILSDDGHEVHSVTDTIKSCFAN